MITEITYNDIDLEEGECPKCGEQTDEIYTPEGMCIDCIEEQRFYEMTMEGLQD